jgi:hypothetical protein
LWLCDRQQIDIGQVAKPPLAFFAFRILEQQNLAAGLAFE